MAVNPLATHPADKLGDGVHVLREHETTIRVRYQETDAQGRVHHSTYANYFELARVEMLRASGIRYRELEQAGINLVVTGLKINYHQGAVFDDELVIRTKVIRAKGVRVQHSYEIYLADQLLVDGLTTIAAIDSLGKVVRLPKWLRLGKCKNNWCLCIPT